jgi:hypothetical protein
MMATRSAAKQRKAQRLGHLAAGLLLIAYVYVPVGPQAETLVRLLVVPLLVLTGVLMWQSPRIRRLLKARRGGHGSHSPAAPNITEARTALGRASENQRQA